MPPDHSTPPIAPPIKQGAADADHPLVRELHALVNANNAEGARRAFEEAIAPLEAQLAQVLGAGV